MFYGNIMVVIKHIFFFSVLSDSGENEVGRWVNETKNV
jgi:hypothetical protein